MKVRRFFLISMVALLALPAVSAPASDTAAADPFPELDAIKGNIDFWTAVFSEWTQGQVAIHDLEHPEILFEVIELPGAIEPTYTDAQTDYLTAVRESWEEYLEALENKVAARESLDDVEKQWAAHYASVVGTDSLNGAHERVRSQRGLRERFRKGLERSFRLDPIIRKIMVEHGLPEDLAYLPHVESSFQYHARSSAGAAGLWQFTRGTGKHYLTINSAIDERLDPIVSTRGAAAYLRDAYEKLEDWPLALTSYNHGVHGMLRAKDRLGTYEKVYLEYDGRSFGFASKNFYAEFLAARRIASEPDRYFPEGYTPEPVHDLDSVELQQRATPAWIAQHYGVPLDELRSLNPAWLDRAVKGGSRLPAAIEVWLPRGTLQRVADLPVASNEVHVVRLGDTLIHIASTYGVRLMDLLSANTLTMNSTIHPGQVLHIPH